MTTYLRLEMIFLIYIYLFLIVFELSRECPTMATAGNEIVTFVLFCINNKPYDLTSLLIFFSES
jgi:hypothetical protein